MVYGSLYNLLKGVADDLGFDVEFQHGRTSDINVFADNNKSVLIWLTPLKRTGSFLNRSNRLFLNWSVELAFYQKDDKDSDNEGSLSILKTSDKILLKYLLDLNQEVVDIDNASDDVEIVNINVTPFIKQTSHVMTGHIVTFNITLPDDFNYCP